MNTLKFIAKRYNLDLSQKSPITLHASRFHELPKLFRKLGFKVGAEIGVSRGYYSKILLRSIPNLKLYGIDPWLKYEGYIELNNAQGQQTTDENLDVAMKRLSPYKNMIFVRKFSMDAVKEFADNSLDFVFIDGNHSFEFVVNDIAEWSKKVKVGGIIAGHDFWHSADGKGWLIHNPTSEELLKLCQVDDAVIGWTNANRIKPWFLLSGDKCKTWFWVKQ